MGGNQYPPCIIYHHAERFDLVHLAHRSVKAEGEDIAAVRGHLDATDDEDVICVRELLDDLPVPHLVMVSDTDAVQTYEFRPADKLPGSHVSAGRTIARVRVQIDEKHRPGSDAPGIELAVAVLAHLGIHANVGVEIQILMQHL